MHVHVPRSLAVPFLAAALALVSACGSSTDGSTSTSGMSATQADAFAKSLSLAATSSMTAFAPPAAAESAAERQVGAAGLVDAAGVSCTPTSCVINQSISARRTCTSGGAIQVTGNISGTVNSSGTGLIQISATETISDWACLPPLLVNGDPYISLVGTFSFVNGSPGTQQHIGISGGIKWTGDGAGSCQIQLSTDFYRNGTGHTTGTVCGHTIDVTF